MERKEVAVYLYIGVLILGALLAVYYFNLGLTGFAVFQQNTESSFNQGTYSNVVYDTNSSAVVLAVNQTSGDYISEIFNAGSGAIWNNLSWVGNGITFQVRSCSSSDCANATFSNADLNNLGLTGQYFQYKVSFDSVNDTLTSVALDYSINSAPVSVSVSVLEPMGEKSSNSGIPLNFAATGTNLTCSYAVVNSVNSQQVLNSTISDCANTTFSLDANSGDYVLTVSVVGNAGTSSDSTSFSLSVSDDEETTEEEEEEVVEEEVIETIPTPTPTVSTTQIALGEIGAQNMVQGESRAMTLSVQNTGTNAVSSCSLKGDSSGWVVISSGPLNLGSGAVGSHGFSVNVPEATAPGAYNIGLSVDCAEISASKQITVNVAQKTFEFNLTDVQRTRLDRVRVDYSLTELTGLDQSILVYFSIKDASGTEIANVTQNSSIDANETDNFRANVPINSSLEGNLTLSANINAQQYSISVNEPITLGAPTGFFVLGDDLGTTGNMLAIAVLVIIVGVVYFFVIRKKTISKKVSD